MQTYKYNVKFMLVDPDYSFWFSPLAYIARVSNNVKCKIVGPYDLYPDYSFGLFSSLIH